MKKIIALFLAALLAIAVGVTTPASATTSTSAPSVVPTKLSDYSTKKKNKYWKSVKSFDSDARLIGKKSIIEMGVLFCDLLRAGGDVSDIAELIVDADPIIEDLLTVSAAVAPVYLCRDQQYKFD
jgi:hypothetical protein